MVIPNQTDRISASIDIPCVPHPDHTNRFSPASEQAAEPFRDHPSADRQWYSMCRHPPAPGHHQVATPDLIGGLKFNQTPQCITGKAELIP